MTLSESTNKVNYDSNLLSCRKSSTHPPVTIILATKLSFYKKWSSQFDDIEDREYLADAMTHNI